MAITQQERNFVVIEIGGYTTKALRDTTDVNILPSVEIRTRAGILKQETEKVDEAVSPLDKSSEQESKLQKQQDQGQEQAKKQQEKAAAAAAASAENGNEGTDSQEKDAEKKKDPAAPGSSTKDTDEPAEPSYIFGTALETIDPELLEATVDIIQAGRVQDWDLLSALLRHILVKELGIRISDNYCPIMFSVPPQWSKVDHEALTQVAFEHLNAPSVEIMEQPLLVVYGNGAISGLVVDFGHSVTTVSAVVDNCIVYNSVAQSTVAGSAVTERLRELLDADEGLRAQMGGEHVSLDFTQAVKESGLCKFQLLSGTGVSNGKTSASGTSASSSSITAAASAAATAADGEAAQQEGSNRGNGSNGASDVPSFKYLGKKYTLPRDVLHKAPEILIRSPPTHVPLVSLMKQAVLACDLERRASLWESIHVVGGSSQFAGIKDFLRFELETTVLPTSNIFANSQSREIKFASLPEYFVGWRNRGHWSAFLGACIVAKITLNDSRHNVTRIEYNESGPSIIHTKSF